MKTKSNLCTVVQRVLYTRSVAAAVDDDDDDDADADNYMMSVSM